MSTIFTKIINREVPAYIVYEDEFVIAFLDISQVTIGHTLVVTKSPFETIFDLPDEIANHVFSVSVKVAKALKAAFKIDGLNLINNNHSKAGQTVFHYHIHLIPRYDNDQLNLNFEVSNLTTHEEYLFRADQIITALND